MDKGVERQTRARKSSKQSIPEKEWERRRQKIKYLYLDCNRKLVDVVEEIREDAFQPSNNQLRNRLARWDMYKRKRGTKVAPNLSTESCSTDIRLSGGCWDMSPEFSWIDTAAHAQTAVNTNAASCQAGVDSFDFNQAFVFSYPFSTLNSNNNVWVFAHQSPRAYQELLTGPLADFYDCELRVCASDMNAASLHHDEVVRTTGVESFARQDILTRGCVPGDLNGPTPDGSLFQAEALPDFLHAVGFEGIL